MSQKSSLDYRQRQSRLFETTIRLWRICDRFPVEDSALVTRMRERATEVLDASVFYFSMSEATASLRSSMIEDLCSKVHVLRSFLELARLRHRIQEMNILMLDWEYEQLLATIDNEVRSREHQNAVARNVLPVDIFTATVPGFSNSEALGASRQGVPRTMPQDSGAAPQTSFTQTEDPIDLLSERQKHLYEFFLQNKKAAMRDLIQNFPGVTDRTLRSDINQLQGAKLIRRVGMPPRHYYRLSTPMEQ